jgi:4a-hydroxytetrahydrobiopterin dehydratase
MSAPACLNPQQIHDALHQLPGWEFADTGMLRRVFEFDTFNDAIAFVNRVAQTANAHNHHPDIHLYYRRVILELTTHDAGGITDRDLHLAQALS